MKLQEALRILTADKDVLVSKNSSLASDREKYLTDFNRMQVKLQDLDDQLLVSNREAESYREKSAQLK
jgi:hypothetical protein